MIDGAPQVMPLAPDLYEDLVQVPLPLRTLPHALRPALADIVREISAKMVHPVTDRFLTDIDTALVK